MLLTSSMWHVLSMASSEWRIANGQKEFPFAIRYSPFAPSPSQIHFDHPLVRRDLIDGPFGQHSTFMQAGDLDAEFAHEGHVVLDDHDGLFLVDFLEQFRSLMGLDV